MPELGKYAPEVLGAYGVSLVLLVLFVGLTLRRGKAAKAALARAEAEVKTNG